MIPALILAGGLGTRLRPIVGELPKPLAPVAGRPFLWWLLRRLASMGIVEAYLSIGYRGALIRQELGESCCGVRLHYLEEDEPLGTGGAIRHGLGAMPHDKALVLNGDTMAIFDLPVFLKAADCAGAGIAMALAPVPDVSRYGAVIIDEDGRISEFQEKGSEGQGLINAGVYLVGRYVFKDFALPEKFSFETGFLGKNCETLHIAGISCVEQFIDIGVPADYEKAQTLVPAMLA